MGEKVISNQNVTVIAGLASGIADWDEPSLSNLIALENVSGAVNWSSMDLNIQASEQQDDRTLTDGAGAQSRGFTNFGGPLEFVHPLPSDTASVFRKAYDIFSNTRVELVVGVRYGKRNSLPPAAGDKWTLYRVITDAVTFGAGDVSRFYRVNLIARDIVLPNYIVPPASPVTVALTALDASVSVGDLVFVSAAYQGWDVTKMIDYVSSDEALLIEVHPGIFQALAAGSPTVIGEYPGATDSTALAITIA